MEEEEDWIGFLLMMVVRFVADEPLNCSTLILFKFTTLSDGIGYLFGSYTWEACILWLSGSNDWPLPIPVPICKFWFDALLPPLPYTNYPFVTRDIPFLVLSTLFDFPRSSLAIVNGLILIYSLEFLIAFYLSLSLSMSMFVFAFVFEFIIS